MPLVSITRFRIRSIRFLPSFFLHTRRAIAQIRKADGFMGGALLNDRRWAFWTMTVWRDEHAMTAYMGSGAHREAMPMLAKWGDEASFVHWSQDGEVRPDWPEAVRRMRDGGRPVPVRYPGLCHGDLSFAEPRTSRGTGIEPSRR